MRGAHANAAEFERQQQQAEALANLATATAADRQAVVDLSISNATLTHELGTQQQQSQHYNSVWQAVSALQRQGQEKRDRNKTSKIHAANLRHWIQMDIAGHMVIT